MKRRAVAAASGQSSGNWLLSQWSETVRSLQARPESRRGQMVISDEALQNCLELVSSDGDQPRISRRDEALLLT